MKTILLIEDNIDVLETTEEILSLADYKVLTAENGKIGVKLAKEHLPDLILCDVMMPELDGYGVLRILSTNPTTYTIPFIFLTAKTEKQDFRKGMNLGADDYITKPFDETDLLEAIESRLKKKSNLISTFSSDGLSNFNQILSNSKGDDAMLELTKNRKKKVVKKKDTIYNENDHANYLYYVISGKVKCLKTDEFGKEFIHDVFSEGSFIGHMSLLVDEEYKESAVAMENTELALIPQQEFIKLINTNRDVMMQFVKVLAGDVIEREKRLLHLAYAPVRERVANSLIDLLQKMPHNNEQFRVSREDLASMVGTAKESLIRTLSEFKKENIIETEGQLIIIKNSNKLKSIAKGHVATNEVD